MTADEYVLAGYNFTKSVTSYLNISASSRIYTLSPNSHTSYGGMHINLRGNKLENITQDTGLIGVYFRHVIVINNQANIASGNGSFNSPFIIN